MGPHHISCLLLPLTDKILNSLSRKYKVSKAVLLVKMLELDYISRQEFDSVLARYVSKEAEKRTEEKKKMVGVTSDQRCLSEVGNKFVSLVANNFDKDFITYVDALQEFYLFLCGITKKAGLCFDPFCQLVVSFCNFVKHLGRGHQKPFTDQ